MMHLAPLAAARSGLTGQRRQRVVVQHPLVSVSPVFASPVTKTPKQFGFVPQWLHSAWQVLLTSVSVLAVTTAIAIFVPALYFKFSPPDVVPVVPTEQGTVLGGDYAAGAQPATAAAQARYIPPVDATLPEGDWLIIPRIGVRTELQQTESPDEALAKGVWMVPGYGDPGVNNLPIILAAHRYGWQWWWQSDYWKYHSFYYLPELQPGDIVEVIADQRKWQYEIYAGAEGGEITDYNADLILYTCKFLNSPVRHFRYARLIDPTKNTQQTLTFSPSEL